MSFFCWIYLHIFLIYISCEMMMLGSFYLNWCYMELLSLLVMYFFVSSFWSDLSSLFFSILVYYFVQGFGSLLILMAFYMSECFLFFFQGVFFNFVIILVLMVKFGCFPFHKWMTSFIRGVSYHSLFAYLSYYKFSFYIFFSSWFNLENLFLMFMSMSMVYFLFYVMSEKYMFNLIFYLIFSDSLSSIYFLCFLSGSFFVVYYLVYLYVFFNILNFFHKNKIYHLYDFFFVFSSSSAGVKVLFLDYFGVPLFFMFFIKLEVYSMVMVHSYYVFYYFFSCCMMIFLLVRLVYYRVTLLNSFFMFNEKSGNNYVFFLYFLIPTVLLF